MSESNSDTIKSACPNPGDVRRECVPLHLAGARSGVSLQTISNWIKDCGLPNAEMVDVNTAMEELHASYEELRVAEEELIQQHEALLDVQYVLEEERLRYQVLFDLAPDSYIVTDSNGVVTDANQAALEMLSIKARFLVGKPLVSFISPAGRPEFRLYLGRMRSEKRCSWDTVMQPRSGAALPVNVVVSAVPQVNTGRSPGTICWLLRDITERRRAEAALFDANQLLNALIEASPVAIAILDSDNRITLWNPAAERILGWRGDEVMGQVPPGVAMEIHGGSDLTSHHSPGARQGVETTLVSRHGEPVNVEIWTAPIHNSAGENMAIVALATDITERKRAETLRLEWMQRLVEVQEEERARLSREMHDHLGQHLTAISLGLEALQAESATVPGGERRAAFERVVQLQKLVDELMRTTHRLAWELRPAELDDMGLATALRHYAERWAQNAGITIDFQTVGDVDQRGLPAAETALFRVAQEALTNIARHAGARSVSVVLKTSEAEIAVIIEDDGSGFDISATALQKRLGLVGMRERLAAVGGMLELESVVGQGTSVFARVPVRA